MFFSPFTYHYQPIIRVDSLTLARYEALLRVKGVADIEGFVRDVQKRSKGVELDIYTLKHVIEYWAAIDSSSRKPIAVNISPNSLKSSHFIEKSLSMLNSNRDVSLSIELTEDARIPETEMTHNYLNAIRDMGVTVGIDDLGDGMAQEYYADIFNLDYIKLSGIIVRDVLDSPDLQKKIERYIDFAKVRNIDIVAEHIDDLKQLEWLKGAGITHGQGWLFAKAAEPLSSPTQFEADLQRRLKK